MSETDGIHWTYKTVCVEPSTKVDSSEALEDFAVLLNDDLALHFDRGWEVMDVAVSLVSQYYSNNNSCL